MTQKYHYNKDVEPSGFSFTPESLFEANKVIAKFPDGRQQSAVLPLLALAQKQNNNWIPKIAMDYIAAMLDMPVVRVYEVASFYTMYNLAPVGENFVQVCTTTPCWLRGSDDIVSACEKRLGIAIGGTTSDGKFTLREVECLGACVNAPMVQVTSHGGEDHYYEDLTSKSVVQLIDALALGSRPKSGSQSGRVSSEPAEE